MTSAGVTSDIISEVRSRANILDVVSEIVVLKKVGKDYKGLCPFHKEKTPSFYVSHDKGIFKCFGCGEGGDVFAFIQRTRSLDFLECVRHLAEKYGVPLLESPKERQEHDRKEQIRHLYERACQFYQQLLSDPGEGHVARQYLVSRGVDEETIKRFRLGYAPASWDSLTNYLSGSESVSTTLLAEAGLAREKQGGGSFYDLFRNRLIVPICDSRGQVVAFGGRTMGDDQIKYLNSPESPIYTKGEHLFGFHLAKESIREKDAVIVVEGYFDAITPHRYGFTNTVATLGTALTEAQARLLVRYTDSKRVYLSFDADAAGQRAVQRGAETLSQIAEGIGMELRIIRIPGGKDPDECLRSSDNGGGPEAFAQAIDQASRLTDYQIEQAISEINLDSHTGKIEAAAKVVPVLGRIKNSIARVEYINQTASRLGVGEEELLAEVREFRRANNLEKQNKGWFDKQGGGNSWKDKNSRNNNYKGKDGSKRERDNGDFNRRDSRRKNSFDSMSILESSAKIPSPRSMMAESGLIRAERQLLAHYLVSKDDHDRVYEGLRDEKLLTPEHQEIKEALEGIGTAFSTIEDLQFQLQDRLAPFKQLSAYLTEIILKVEEIRKQDLPLDVVLKDYRAKIVKERITDCITRCTSQLKQARDESEQDHLQCKIRELTLLNRVELRTLDDIIRLKLDIDRLELD